MATRVRVHWSVFKHNPDLLQKVLDGTVSTYEEWSRDLEGPIATEINRLSTILDWQDLCVRVRRYAKKHLNMEAVEVVIEDQPEAQLQLI